MSAANSVETLLASVPVRKPSNQWFVRTCPNLEYWMTTNVLEYGDEKEIYMVNRSLWLDFENVGSFRPMTLILSQNKQGLLFWWPVKESRQDSKENDWNKSAKVAAKEAQEKWVRMQSDMKLKMYKVTVASRNLGEPNWDNLPPLRDLLETAFKDKYIDSSDHPVLKEIIRGEM